MRHPEEAMTLEQHRRTLVTLIYAAAYDSRRWRDVALALSEALGGHAATVWLRLPGAASQPEVYRSHPGEQQPNAFHEEYVERNPWGDVIPVDEASREITRRFVSLDVLLPTEELVQSKFFKRVSEEFGFAPASPLSHVFALSGDRPLAAMNCLQLQDKPPFTLDQISFLDTLVPHLKRAHTIIDVMRSITREAQVAREVIDRLPAGLILLDENGRVVALNQSAEHSIEKGSPLQIRDGRPVATEPGHDRWLQEAIRKAQSSTTRNAGEAELPVRVLDAGQAKTPTLVIPLLPPTSNSTLPDNAVLIFLGNPRLDRETTITLLGSLYELTPAEAELTWMLADGLSLEDAASERNVTLNTARSQLKRVFTKTGAKRQAELVRAVLGSVGAMREKN